MKHTSAVSTAALVILLVTLITWTLLRPRPKPTVALSPCYPAYARFFVGAETEIRVVFGYKDSRPARFVGDRYERNAFVNSLTKPCPIGQYACGFERDDEDGDLFLKHISGPDGNPHLIRLLVTDSSAGPDDDENRRDRYQARLSQMAQTRFLDGVKVARAVFYNGHSRDGGGPDFSPPKLGDSHGHIHYWWYGTKKPGLTALTSALRESSQAQLLGLFSCVSTGFFAKEIKKARKDIALITHSELLYHADAMETMRGGLSALLGMKCKAEVDSALRAESTGGKSTVQGFFD